MWELIIGAVLVVGVLLVGGWLICCRATVYRQWSEMVRKQIQGLKDAWGALPRCPGPPRPPCRIVRCGGDELPRCPDPPGPPELRRAPGLHLRCEVDVPAGATIHSDTTVYEAVYNRGVPGVIRQTTNRFEFELLLDDDAIDNRKSTV